MSSIAEAPAARFLRSAQICRIRDLNQLLAFSDLIKDISELIHALQKERGAASVFLGSQGTHFCEHLAARVNDSRALELAVRDRFEHMDERLDRMSCGARFFVRVAAALTALESTNATRAQVLALTLAPQDAVKLFTHTIGALLAVVFEAADIAADPKISQAMIALVNFTQGKEYAGQERATAGAGFSRGRFEASEIRRLYHLTAAQDQAFRIFSDFTDPVHAADFRKVEASDASAQVEALRKIAFAGGQFGELSNVTGEMWFEQATIRIDGLKAIESQLAAALQRLCQTRLAEVSAESDRAAAYDAGSDMAPIAVLVRDADPALSDAGQDGGIGLYSMGGAQPKLMRSILDVMRAQSRRIHDVSNELDAARTELNDRKIIDRAKALLMSARNLSEQDAYALMRKTAMNQHKRMAEVAQAILSMADILTPGKE